MRVGIQLPEVEREVRWPEYLAMARAAEAAGFDSIWYGDHLIYRANNAYYSGAQQSRPERGPWEAWTMLAALAAVTERVTIGPLVACLGFHPPAVLAKMAATVDEVSGGRLMFGVGAGWNEDEFRAFGIPFDKRVSRFAEGFEVVRGLLAGERVSLDGRFVDVEDAVLLPPPARRVPLMVGSNGPRVLGLTLPHVDAWNTWYTDIGNSAEGFAALNDRITAAARDAGRDPATLARSTCLYVVFDRDAPERPIEPDAPPVEPGRVAAAIAELDDAGADEVILVASPITERTIVELGSALSRS